jgi:hypothetical protein
LKKYLTHSLIVRNLNNQPGSLDQLLRVMGGLTKKTTSTKKTNSTKKPCPAKKTNPAKRIKTSK